MENNYGWVCPKCGCPNSPTNKTCVACFSTECIDITAPADLAARCVKCGMDLSGPNGYVCPDYNCPQRASLKPFNPLNAADNFDPRK